MATVNPLITQAEPYDGSIVLFSWTMVTAGDVGAAMPFSQWADRSVQFNGTWAAGTVVWEGSNDGVNYETLTDAQSVALSKTANALKEIVEITQWARPRVQASVTSVIVTCLARRAQQLRV